MQDALAVRAVERIRDLAGALERLGKRQRPAGEPVGQRLAVEPLHDEEVDAVLVADVVQGADVRVVQRRDGARLTLEARAPLRRGRRLLAQDLDGDGTIEPRVPGVVHLSHAAGAQRPDDLVRSEAGAWDQWHFECLRSRDYIPASPAFAGLPLGAGFALAIGTARHLI